MGYDLHITRRPDWGGEGADITAEEWVAYLRGDPDLQLSVENGPYMVVWRGASSASDEWLDWSDGQIYAKNPSPGLVEKMIAVAGRFGAKVQGDDGEIYGPGAEPRQPSGAPLWQTVADWFRRAGTADTVGLNHSALPFRVGDRVRDTWRRQGVVTAVDPRAEHGVGLVRVRYDDGAEVAFGMSAHPFEKVEGSESP